MVELELEKGAVLSGVVPKAVGLVKVARVDRAKVKVKTAIKVKKCTMASPLSCLPTHKALETGLKGPHQKGENPSIRVQENPAILAKASDF